MKLVLASLVLRPLLHSPARFLVTVLGVAVGIASVVATLASSRAAVSSLREGVEEVAGKTQFEISQPGGLPEEVLAELRPLAREALLVPVVEDLAVLPGLGQAGDTVRLLGLDLLVDGAIRDLRIAGGEKPGAARGGPMVRGEGIVVPESLARELGLEVGDDLALRIRTKEITQPVVGIFKPEDLASVWDRILLLDVALAQELCGKVGRIDRIEVRPRGDLQVEVVRAKAEQLLGGRYAVSTPTERADQTGRMVRALQFNLTALSGISLLVGAVLVATTLATSVVQRRSILALLRSLGASKAQIVAALLAESLTLGLAGGILGVLGGVVVAQLALASFRSTLAAVVRGAPAASLHLSAGDAAIGILMGVGVSLVAAVLPLREALRTPPIQNLRKEHPERLSRRGYWTSLGWLLVCGFLSFGLAQLPPFEGDLPVAALFSALVLMVAVILASSPAVDLAARVGSGRTWQGQAISVRLAAAGLAAGRRRASWAAGAIGVAVALAVGMATMVDSFRQTVLDWTDQAMRSDLWIRPAKAETGVPVGNLDPEIVEIALRQFGSEAVDPFHSSTATFQGHPISISCGVISVVQKHGGIPFKDGRPTGVVLQEMLDTGGILVNEPFFNRYGLGQGDILEIETPGGILTKRITGVFLDYGNQLGRVILDRSEFLSLYPDEGPDGIAVFLPEQVDAAQAREELSAALEGRFQVEMMLNRELRQEVLRIFDQTFAITSAMQVVASVVAVIAVLTVLFALLGERRQDLALLRAIGADRRQVGSVVVWQAGLLGFLGATGGLVGGLLVGLVLVKVVNLQSFGWTLQFLFPWRSMFLIVVGVTAACFAAGFGPAFSAMRTAPSEALRDEA